MGGYFLYLMVQKRVFLSVICSVWTNINSPSSFPVIYFTLHLAFLIALSDPFDRRFVAVNFWKFDQISSTGNTPSQTTQWHFLLKFYRAYLIYLSYLSFLLYSFIQQKTDRFQ